MRSDSFLGWFLVDGDTCEHLCVLNNMIVRLCDIISDLKGKITDNQEDIASALEMIQDVAVNLTTTAKITTDWIVNVRELKKTVDELKAFKEEVEKSIESAKKGCNDHYT